MNMPLPDYNTLKAQNLRGSVECFPVETEQMVECRIGNKQLQSKINYAENTEALAEAT
jgi:hypothetical protein